MRGSAAAMAALLLASCSSQDKAGNEANGSSPATGPTSGTGSPAAVAASLQPGEWETTIEILRMTMPNMPKGATPPTQPPITVRHCLTAEEAARPNANFITGSNDNGGCTYQNFSMQNGRLQGAVQCNAEGSTMRSTMDGTFTPTSYQLNSQVHTEGSGMTMDMETRISARRTGDCPR